VRAAQAREIAANCLNCALKGNFKKAAHLRQKAYAFDQSGFNGDFWENWSTVWESDSRYLRYLELENFSDMDNSQEFISAFKAAIFIDQLFCFRDFWAIDTVRMSTEEIFQSSLLESFLVSKRWTFNCEVRAHIYARTKEHNISAKIYNDSLRKNKSQSLRPSHIYPIGEYDLGFAEGTPEHVVEGRRLLLANIDQYQDMSKYQIEKFPKTFQTFEKHKRANSEKYQEWMRQYSRLKAK